MDYEERELILEITAPAITALTPGQRVKVRQLFDPTLWKSLSWPERRWLGTRVSLLVAMKALPLRPKGRNGSHHNVYEAI